MYQQVSPRIRMFTTSCKGIGCVSVAFCERAHTVLFECLIATTSPEYPADIFLVQRPPFHLIQGKILPGLQTRMRMPRETEDIVDRITHTMGASGSADK